MDVSQVLSLSSWYGEYCDSFIGKYSSLSRVLEHNSKQPQKQAVREPLDDLTSCLEDLPVEELTNEELAKLDELGVLELIGERGAEYVLQTVTSGEYDPASAALDIQQATQRLQQHKQYFKTVGDSLRQVGFRDGHWDDVESQTAIRVRFQDDASISDVVLLKKWSNDWHDIIRGASMCVGEKPNETRVVSANNGSIVLTLAGTASVTLVLATIVKNIGTIVHEGLKIANAIEDLRHKKILNRAIETELTKQQEELQENGVATTVEEVKATLGGEIDGGVEAALKKAVEKYLNFNDKGGDVDFVPPKNSQDPEFDHDIDNGDQIGEIAPEIRQLRELLTEVRTTKAEILRLSDLRDDAE